jgi:hypothetical protein
MSYSTNAFKGQYHRDITLLSSEFVLYEISYLGGRADER